jgi:hypothetical protein
MKLITGDGGFWKYQCQDEPLARTGIQTTANQADAASKLVEIQ